MIIDLFKVTVSFWVKKSENDKNSIFETKGLFEQLTSYGSHCPIRTLE